MAKNANGWHQPSNPLKGNAPKRNAPTKGGYGKKLSDIKPMVGKVKMGLTRKAK